MWYEYLKDFFTKYDYPKPLDTYAHTSHSFRKSGILTLSASFFLKQFISNP